MAIDCVASRRNTGDVPYHVVPPNRRTRRHCNQVGVGWQTLLNHNIRCWSGPDIGIAYFVEDVLSRPDTLAFGGFVDNQIGLVLDREAYAVSVAVGVSCFNQGLVGYGGASSCTANDGGIEAY